MLAPSDEDEESPVADNIVVAADKAKRRHSATDKSFLVTDMSNPHRRPVIVNTVCVYINYPKEASMEARGALLRTIWIASVSTFCVEFGARLRFTSKSE